MISIKSASKHTCCKILLVIAILASLEPNPQAIRGLQYRLAKKTDATAYGHIFISKKKSARLQDTEESLFSLLPYSYKCPV